MARHLNQNRMFWSTSALLVTVVIVLVSRQFWRDPQMLHEVFELVGVVLVSLCAMGRIYATAFLGGFKNSRLITYGPYSIVRNPLYFFTLLGVTGIALISNHVVVMVLLPLTFLVIYTQLIAREEAFLQLQFGEAFSAYKAEVSALWPSFSNYRQLDLIEVSPRHLNRAFMDAIWWLAALPAIELIEYLQEACIVPTFFTS